MSTGTTHSARKAAIAIVGLLVACTGRSAENPGQTPRVVMDQDRITLPPLQREATSWSGNYAFIVTAEDEWRSSRASGELVRVAAGRRTPAWKISLPEPFGPRFVLLDDRGNVLLVDEWTNTVTRHALVLFDVTGRERAHYTFDDIRTATGLSGSTIVHMAVHGSWLMSVPALDGAAQTATFTAGGKTLSVSLTDGHLSVIGQQTAAPKPPSPLPKLNR
jgi:hypothetical protein